MVTKVADQLALVNVEADLEGWRVRRVQPAHRTGERGFATLDVELWYEHEDGTITKLHGQFDRLDNLRDALPMLRWAVSARPGIRFDMARGRLDPVDHGWLDRANAGRPRVR